MKTSTTSINQATGLHELTVYPTWSLPEFASRLDKLRQSWPVILNYLTSYAAFQTLKRVRTEYPFVVVVFRDRNVEEDMFLQVDISPFETTGRVERVIGANPLPPKQGRPDRVPYLVVNAGRDDLLDLASGLQAEFPPSVYLYCCGAQAIDISEVKRAIEKATDWDNLHLELVTACDVLLFAGPDAAYQVITSRELAKLAPLQGNNPKVR